jgi:3-hydroxy acid dehydrogenase / malonic semialdehyde reductase
MALETQKQTASSLDGKRVLLTGGTTGIGRALLIALASQGARLLTCGRNQDPLNVALKLAGLPSEAGLTADVCNQGDLHRLFSAVDERLGGLDIAICNAAVGARSITEMDNDKWRYVVETNLVGYMACARAAIDRMAKQQDGHILLVSSISGDIPMGGESVYAATKAGVDGFALALRQELRDAGIAVSTVSPGSVGSDMQECSVEHQRQLIEREEMLYAEDVADAAMWILTRPHRCDVFDVRIEPRRQQIPAKG